jgi:peptidase M1-like protein
MVELASVSVPFRTLRQRSLIRCFKLMVLAFLATGFSTYSVASEVRNPRANSDPVYEQLRTLNLSGEFCPVEDLVVRRDTATFRFKHGEFHFLAPVEGRVTGGVFLGEGEFEFTPSQIVEQRHLGLLTGKASIQERFNKLLLRFTDATSEEIRTERTPKSGTPNSTARGVLENYRKMLRKGKASNGVNLDARILTDLTWQGQSGFFLAMFDGSQFGDMAFTMDPLGHPVVAPEEVSLTLFGETNHGLWAATHLKEHYASAALDDESHQLIDLVHHNIAATAKGKHLAAVVETRFKAVAEGARVLPFDLFGRLRVSKVKDGEGHDLNFIQEDKDEDPALSVILPQGLKKGQESSLTFEYAGNDAVSDSGGGNFTLDARDNWYPNSFFGDRATYDMTFRIPKSLSLVATGQLIGESQEGDFLVSHWKSDIPLAVAGFNYGRFKKSSVQDEKIHYSVETYANREVPDFLQAARALDETLASLNTTHMMEKARNEAQAAMQLYTHMFGPLPYGRIAMTQQPYFSFGQAWPMLVYMPVIAFLDSTHRHALNMDATDFVQYVSAHEVAHQWWGHIVGWKSYRDQWMSEGFSEFSASIFAQAFYKNNQFIEFWKKQREQITQKNRFGFRPIEVGSVTMGYRLNTAKTGAITRDMIYPKGGFILHMLRMLMFDSATRDERFGAMMQDFIKTHYNQNVSTLDFQRTVEKHMTKEMDLEGNGKMDWFFRQWVYGTALPSYKLDYSLDPATDGKVKLRFKITQSNVDDAFRMRVPVYVDFESNLQRLGTVPMAGNATTKEIEVMLPKKPKRVVLNGWEDVLAITQ